LSKTVSGDPTRVKLSVAYAIFLGDATVSAAGNADRGIKVASEATREVWLNAGDDLYAISAAGTGSSFDVAVLYSKVLA
jgi:hypothetical protein